MNRQPNWSPKSSKQPPASNAQEEMNEPKAPNMPGMPKAPKGPKKPKIKSTDDLRRLLRDQMGKTDLLKKGK